MPAHPPLNWHAETVENALRTLQTDTRSGLTAAEVAAAMGAGLLLKLLPARAVVRPLTTLAVTLLPPALLGLGLLKAFELCCQQAKLKPDRSR